MAKKKKEFTKVKNRVRLPQWERDKHSVAEVSWRR
jgi:hypothetical protein